MVEDEFFVEVGGDVFPVEFCVELRGDCGNGLGFAEDKGEGDVFVLLLCAFLREGLRPEDLCIGIGGMPGAKEDVVLSVVSIYT